MSIQKIIDYEILFGYNTKFSGLVNKEMYGHQLGELHDILLLSILGSERVNCLSPSSDQCQISPHHMNQFFIYRSLRIKEMITKDKGLDV